jgi:taurine transport system substrate-binding protein
MKSTRRHQRRALLGALPILVALSVAACGSDNGGSATASKPSSEAPSKITVAYQAIPNGDLVVKHEKWLEKALPNTQIEWKLFDSGGTVNEAVAARAVDIGLAGSSPVARGLSQPLPYEVPWIHDVIGTAEALVVRKGINSLADLKGKKVATPLASTSHYSLLAALDDAGVPQKDVKVVDAEPDVISAAWSRGDIDAAYVWNPNLAKLVKDGGKILTTSADLAKKGKTTYDLAVVTKAFAGKYPKALATWVGLQDRAVKLYRSNPDQWATDVAAELNITKADAASQAKGLIFLTANEQTGADYLGGGLARNLYTAAQFNKTLGQIPSVQPESAYSSGVLAGPAQQVAGA